MKRIKINQVISFDYTGPNDRYSILLAKFNHMKNINYDEQMIDSQLLSNGYSVSEIKKLFNPTAPH